jgi:hypothetical protein
VTTASTNAFTNTITPASITGVPIFLVDGTKVANDYADLWDGSLAAPINITELDSLPPLTGGIAKVWTGSSRAGTNDGRPMGITIPRSGLWNATNGNWIRQEAELSSNQYPLYAISEVITVPVSEPSTIFCFGLLAFGLVICRTLGNNLRGGEGPG